MSDNSFSKNSVSRERLLAAAEKHFSQKGYRSVTLRDIAAEIGIRQASLYHHAPGGKENLFVEVMERIFRRHRNGLREAIGAAQNDLRSKLRAVSEWLLSQQPMDLVRMTHSDMPSINEAAAQRLSETAYESMIVPVMEILSRAENAGEIKAADTALIAGAFVGMVESLHAVPEEETERKNRIEMAFELIDIWLNGLNSHN